MVSIASALASCVLPMLQKACCSHNQSIQQVLMSTAGRLAISSLQQGLQPPWEQAFRALQHFGDHGLMEAC